MEKSYERYIFLATLVMRTITLTYGVWQDNNFEVQYTDIDYHVYTDAAEYVHNGLSPYERHTYRYTPLLAYLMLPNKFFFEFGKLLFVAADLVCGYFIVKSLRVDKLSASYVALYLLNPMVDNICTRGSSDSISSLLIVGTVYFLKVKNIEFAAVFYGLAVHFRIYPLIYGLSFWLFIDKHSTSFFTTNRLKFFLISAGCFLALFAAFYATYGWEFAHETYFYHLARKDNRHNFSLYFYMLYLTYQSGATGLGLLAFVPQWGLIMYMGYAFSRHNLNLTMLAQTFIFVMFNKVCTAQYFLWYMTLLPLCVPYLHFSAKRGLAMILTWIVSEAHWLYWGYRLEFLGENVFFSLWLASVCFFGANLWILYEITLKLSISPGKSLKR